MNLSQFGFAPPIPGSWWRHAALHASWPWHIAGAVLYNGQGREIDQHPTIFYQDSTVFYCILASHLHNELLCTKFCQSLVALLQSSESEVMFSSGEGIQMPRNVGSVLHSQFEVVKEEPSTGQNYFGILWIGRAKDSEGMWLQICNTPCSAWRPAKLETPWLCWAAQGWESSAANPNRCQQPDKIWPDVNGFFCSSVCMFFSWCKLPKTPKKYANSCC